MTLSLFPDHGGAEFSSDRTYRYRLWRRWGAGAPACFCMLNPSTGNEAELDPTLRRCVGFARAWGCDGLEVVNLFAVVSPDPKVLLTHADPVGSLNDAHILDSARISSVLVVGWGAFPEAKERAKVVAGVLARAGLTPMCLGLNADSSPKHPLYVPKTATLREWGGEQ